MYKNYITIALRNLLKNKLFSFINIMGLAVGLATAVLIFLFVRDELSWDSGIVDAERLFRVELSSFPDGREPFHLAVAFTPMKEFFEQDFSEIEQATRLRYASRTIEKAGVFFAENAAFTDANFFDVFELSFLEGNSETALEGPSSVVLSAQTARKYFGEARALGQRITLDNGKSYQVTGVIADLPVNSHMTLDLIFPFTRAEFPASDVAESVLDDWFNLGTYIYIRLNDARDAAEVEGKFPAFLDLRGPRPSERTIPSERWTFNLVNIQDIHLTGAPLARIKPRGNMKTIYAFAVIAVLVLVIAGINFVNLSTARSTLRSKEVAMRKVLGASRNQLVMQFLIEAVITALVALLVALILVELALPFYNVIVKKMLLLDMTGDPGMLAALVGLLLVMGLGAGSYPALILSRFRPAAILHQRKGDRQGSPGLRSILVVIQFAVGTVLMIASAIVYLQVQYSINRDAGFSSENIMVLGKISDPKVLPKAAALKQSLLSHPYIVAVSLSSAVPADSMVVLDGYGEIDGVSLPDPIIVNWMTIDHDFLPAYDISVLAGRGFDRARASDIQRKLGEGYQNGSVILNESAVRSFGFTGPEGAIGHTFTGDTSQTVIGVVPNTHMTSSRAEPKPVIYVIDEEGYGRLSLRYQTSDLPSLVRDVEAIWAKLIPDVPLAYEFLDQKIAGQYMAEKARGLMFAIFAALAIFVSSLGLLGLSSFTAESRTREVGIRKVMGASNIDIIRLMVWQFSKPVLIANLVAAPIAWYLTRDWLNQFVDRIALTPWPFILAGLFTLLIAWLTVAGHAIRVARANPIHALRYE